VHVVDLDAARTGQPVNRAVVRRIAASVGVRVQAGGGVRSAADADELLGSGVERVVIGTAAVEDPNVVTEIAERWPGRVAVGLDHRDGEVRLRGWAEGGGRRVLELIPRMLDAGASVLIVTDIARDGRLTGPDVTGLAALLEATGAPLIASGGVASLDDIRQLSALRGLAGVIVGKALYEGSFGVGEALAACRAFERDLAPGEGVPGEGVPGEGARRTPHDGTAQERR
ncbi:MAG: HisA/HisF-related TIM barrel protein, partial [Acidimicrobiales bacterium]